MSNYPFYGHDDGLVISGPDTGFAERPMTPAELTAREPARKIAEDIYRHANYAGVCYAEIWRTIADAFEQQGISAADCESHKLEVGGSSPPPATSPQAPIAKVIVRDDGPADVVLYAPGLPPGEHDLYCEPPDEMAQLRAAYEFVLPYVHVDIRAQALAIYEPEQTPLEKHIGSLGNSEPK
jgi:hypothetical protein